MCLPLRGTHKCGGCHEEQHRGVYRIGFLRVRKREPSPKVGGICSEWCGRWGLTEALPRRQDLMGRDEVRQHLAGSAVWLTYRICLGPIKSQESIVKNLGRQAKELMFCLVVSHLRYLWKALSQWYDMSGICQCQLKFSLCIHQLKVQVSVWKHKQ